MACQGEAVRAWRCVATIGDCFDPVMGLPEKLLFGGGRRWVCGQAGCRVLEIAGGVGAYPPA
jgi:hypothetical protein